MSHATQRQMHISAALSNLAIGYVNDELRGLELAPRFTVHKEDGKIRVLKKDGMRIEQTIWANGSPTPRSKWGFGTDITYSLTAHALAEVVTRREQANADLLGVAIQPAVKAVRTLTDKLAVELEADIASLLTTAGNYGTANKKTLSGSSQWSDAASDPVGNLTTAVDAVHDATGKRPNVLALPWKVFIQLRQHPAITSQYVYTSGGVLQPDQIGQVVGIPRTVVLASVKNTAKQGAADALTDVWGKFALVAFVDPNPQGETATLAVTFSKDPVRMVDSWPDEDSDGTVYRARDMYQAKGIDFGCGYLFTTAVA